VINLKGELRDVQAHIQRGLTALHRKRLVLVAGSNQLCLP